MFTAPDLSSRDDLGGAFRAHWSRSDLYVDEGHRGVFEETQGIPGFQMPADTFKLYEMGHYCGDVILEIGTYGGRSAVVALKGARSDGRRQHPYFFSIDIDPGHVRHTYERLAGYGLEPFAALFRGNLRAFARQFHISPTMVFVDGDHRYRSIKSDLSVLSSYLRPGIPVLCHDYLNPDNDTGVFGVRRAVNEWEEDGYAVRIGTAGCSALLVTSERCTGPATAANEAEFAKLRAMKEANTRLTVRRWLKDNVPVLARVRRRFIPG